MHIVRQTECQSRKTDILSYRTADANIRNILNFYHSNPEGAERVEHDVNRKEWTDKDVISCLGVIPFLLGEFNSDIS